MKVFYSLKCNKYFAGPTAIMALMIMPYVALNQGFAYFISFITGAFILLLGILNLGK